MERDWLCLLWSQGTVLQEREVVLPDGLLGSSTASRIFKQEC